MAVAICIGFLTMEWNAGSNFSVKYCNCFTFLLGIALIGLPIYIIVYYFKKVGELDDEEFQERYGTLYDGMKIERTEKEKDDETLYKRKVSVMFPFLCVLRRLIFIAIAIGLAQWPLL